MQLEFLNYEGIDEKYYQWKDVITHTLLNPLLTITDDKHTFHVYSTFPTSELQERYGKELVNRIDNNYNVLLQRKRVLLIQLLREEDIEKVKQSGFPPNGIFAVWKDDLLKANPVTCATTFTTLDINELMKDKGLMKPESYQCN